MNLIKCTERPCTVGEEQLMLVFGVIVWYGMTENVGLMLGIDGGSEWAKLCDDGDAGLAEGSLP